MTLEATGNLLNKLYNASIVCQGSFILREMYICCIIHLENVHLCVKYSLNFNRHYFQKIRAWLTLT